MCLTYITLVELKCATYMYFFCFITISFSIRKSFYHGWLKIIPVVRWGLNSFYGLPAGMIYVPFIIEIDIRGSHFRVSAHMCGRCQRSCTAFVMMTSWNNSLLRVTGPLSAEVTGQRWIPIAKASVRGFDIFLWRRWYKMSFCSLWRHCDVICWTIL